MMSVWDELQWRGMVYDASEGLQETLTSEAITAYVGFDPSAPSLHGGSLLPVMALARLQRHGHTPIAIVGGGTGMIGDPSGKTQERPLLSTDMIDSNVQYIKAQLSRFLDFGARNNPAMIINNAEWLRPLDLMTFLRDIGKYFTINYMLAKESVARRLDQGEGTSYTEFSYMLLQAYDYLVLHDRYGCTLQMGGSDQWGNITAGTELIRRLRGARTHALVFPLLTTPSGSKFGKTEAGNVWLDSELTSPFRFYQFWLNTDDRDVIAYLRYFTMLDREAIDELAGVLTEAPERREPQRRLAREVTQMVHGQTALQKAERASQVLFGEDLAGLGVEDLRDVFADVPSSQVAKARFTDDGMPVVDLVISCGLAESKGQARRLIEGGGIYLNNRRVADVDGTVALDAAVGGEIIVLRRGAQDYHLVEVEDEQA